MGRTVYKYAFVVDELDLTLRYSGIVHFGIDGADFVAATTIPSLGAQHDVTADAREKLRDSCWPKVWIELDDQLPERRLHLRFFGTGYDIPDYRVPSQGLSASQYQWMHIASCVVPNLVWHLYCDMFAEVSEAS